MAEAYIVAAARTAGGRKGGRLAGWHPADLAASVLDSLVERSGAAPDQIDDVIMGCVGQGGEHHRPVRDRLVARDPQAATQRLPGACDPVWRLRHLRGHYGTATG